MNADLFRAADLALSVEGLPLNQPLSSLPTASKSHFSAIDAAFNNKLVGLHAALPLGDLVRHGSAALKSVPGPPMTFGLLGLRLDFHCE